MSSSVFSDVSSDELLSDSESEKSEEPEEVEAKSVSSCQVEDDETQDDKERVRFLRELEFVQCFANPRYINWLSSRNYFGDPAFNNYLKYLLYWTKPEYAKYLKYPQAIHFLRLVQDPEFRTFIGNQMNLTMIESEQFKYWQFYRRNRTNLTLPEVELKVPDNFE